MSSRNIFSVAVSIKGCCSAGNSGTSKCKRVCALESMILKIVSGACSQGKLYHIIGENAHTLQKLGGSQKCNQFITSTKVTK